MYQGFYINLERDAERRNQMEQHLLDLGLADNYTRFPAVDASTTTYGPDALPAWATLGCMLSHLSIIKNQIGTDLHLHILEDDAVLHKDIVRVFESFLSHQQAQDWDLLITDVFLPPDVYLFKHLHQKFLKSKKTGSINFLDIAGWDFAGASSYFVNKESKGKVLELVEHGFPPEVPYDIRIRELAKSKMLKVYLSFPFFSTLSASCSNSTIAGAFEPVLPLFEYRRSFYIEPDLETINRNLIPAEPLRHDLHTQIYLNLINTLIDPKYGAF